MNALKKLKLMSVDDLKRTKAQKEAAVRRAIGFFPNVVRGEIEQINRELQRREPKTVYYAVVLNDLHHGDGIWFFYPKANGERRRVHPRGPEKQTQYPQDLCADEVNAWMHREGITHVFADTEDDETSNECIKRGKHTRAAFIKWWRQLEDQDESFCR